MVLRVVAVLALVLATAAVALLWSPSSLPSSALALASGIRNGTGTLNVAEEAAASLSERSGPGAAEREILVADCSHSRAVGVAVGLLNRGGPTADCDDKWSGHLGFRVVRASGEDVIKRALAQGLVKGRVLFERSLHVHDNLALSAAGVLDLLPVSADDAAARGVAAVAALPVELDFTAHGLNISTHAAALEWSMAHLMPRADKTRFVYRPVGTKLVPFIAMERLLAVFVDDIATKCVEYNLAPFDALAEVVAKANGLKPFLDFTSAAHWDVSEKALTMFGYSSGIFESTGYCTRNKTMGVAASDIADSLSLLLAVQRRDVGTEISRAHPASQRKRQQQRSGAQAETEALTEAQGQNQKKAPMMQFNASKRYVSHVVSDGDNLSLLHATITNLQRTRALCAERHAADPAARPCAPRAWTVSGRTDTVSAALRAMYAVAADPGSRSADSFVLPPSGASYWYPASAAESAAPTRELQRAATLAAAGSMDIRATVLWDFFFKFASSKHRAYLQGFVGSEVKAVFWSAAPWLLSPNEKKPFVKLGYKSDQVLRDPRNSSVGLVVFRELTRWDGLAGHDTVNGKHLSIPDMARLLQQQPPGSLNAVYDISWGVLPDDFQRYADFLSDHHPDVELVDHRTLIDFACQKYGLLDC